MYGKKIILLLALLLGALTIWAQSVNYNTATRWEEKLSRFSAEASRNPFYPEVLPANWVLLQAEALLEDENLSRDNHIIYVGTTKTELVLLVEIFRPNSRFAYGGYWTYQMWQIGEENGRRYKKNMMILDEAELENAFSQNRIERISNCKTGQDVVSYMHGYKEGQSTISIDLDDLFIGETSLELYNITFKESFARVGNE